MVGHAAFAADETVNFRGVTRHWLFVPAMGAALTLICGLALREIRPGQKKLEDASYDNLCRMCSFATYPTNNVVLVMMDNYSYGKLNQTRYGPPYWDRKLHAQLLNKLADDQSALVVLDVIFRSSNAVPEPDKELAAAMRRQGHVVLREVLENPELPGGGMSGVVAPYKDFLVEAAGVGLGHAELVTNNPVRRHWPFPSSHEHPSLPWTAAVLSQAKLSPTPEERWMRYYGANGNWTNISYYLALNKGPGFFRDKVVFIGQEPENKNPTIGENDKFRTPYGTAVGGVEILATTYLNLVRHDWLTKSPEWVETWLIVVFGLLAGAGLALTRRWVAVCISVVVFFAVAVTAIYVTFCKGYWFDWMMLAGAQLPCALAWTWFAAPLKQRKAQLGETIASNAPGTAQQDRPDTPDYDLADEPFGKGAYGRVWLARNAIGQWQALKAVYMSGFQYADPYEREFNGITRYKPVSEKHAGLLRIDFISQKKPDGYFYYVMELGDSLVDGWEDDPNLYKPKDLAAIRKLTEGNRLPVDDCIRIGIVLADALSFLHEQGLTHRDIKPQNIIFVRGQPKLADVGLIAEIRANPMEGTWVGTPGYMPPMPEPPGTVPADIYGLGMVMYVIRTGREPDFFPGISTTLAEQARTEEFAPLNSVILRACNPDLKQRFASAAEMREALREALAVLTST